MDVNHFRYPQTLFPSAKHTNLKELCIGYVKSFLESFSLFMKEEIGLMNTKVLLGPLSKKCGVVIHY